ncbi:MAG: hypothetical protein GY809_03900, partial [Planctomycetes bacterium]|nr:hypothetical protein [Planctomycetota bacterium]
IKICLGENGIDKAELSKAVKTLEHLVNGSGDDEAVLDIIRELVPKYNYVREPADKPESSVQILELKAMTEGKKELKKI